jgi:hypothetical protein
VSAELLLALLALAGENRLAWVDVELVGACAEVRFDCGAAGETVLRGPFLAGESRILVVPVPVASPLGIRELGAVALPEVEVLPPGAPARLRVIGWSSSQPAARHEALPVALQNPPCPPRLDLPSRAGLPELLLVFSFGLWSTSVRTRRRALFWVGPLVAAGAFALARGRGAEEGASQVLAFDARAGTARLVTCGPGRLPLLEWLEVEPEGAFLRFECRANGEAFVATPGVRCRSAEVVALPDLLGSTNRFGEDLRATWTRSATGSFQGHGPWPRGTVLSAGAPSPAPPGWLASGLPQGLPVLLAHSASGLWLWGLLEEPESTPSGD